MSRVALIIGVGPNIGSSVSKIFREKGYKLGLASRSLKAENSTADELHIPVDCANTDTIGQAFAAVREKYGHPSVVVYNPYNETNNDGEDPLSYPAEQLRRGVTVNILSPYVAAQEAIKGWKELPSSIHTKFIFTGNCTNMAPIPSMLDLSVGKSGAAAFIDIAATAYKDTNYEFYYSDQREENGRPMYTGLSGEAHAQLYIELAERTSQGPWQQTFVKGIGYKKFHDPPQVIDVNV